MVYRLFVIGVSRGCGDISHKQRLLRNWNLCLVQWLFHTAVVGHQTSPWLVMAEHYASGTSVMSARTLRQPMLPQTHRYPRKLEKALLQSFSAITWIVQYCSSPSRPNSTPSPECL